MPGIHGFSGLYSTQSSSSSFLVRRDTVDALRMGRMATQLVDRLVTRLRKASWPSPAGVSPLLHCNPINSSYAFERYAGGAQFW